MLRVYWWGSHGLWPRYGCAPAFFLCYIYMYTYLYGTFVNTLVPQSSSNATRELKHNNNMYTHIRIYICVYIRTNCWSVGSPSVCFLLSSFDLKNSDRVIQPEDKLILFHLKNKRKKKIFLSIFILCLIFFFSMHLFFFLSR